MVGCGNKGGMEGERKGEKRSRDRQGVLRKGQIIVSLVNETSRGAKKDGLSFRYAIEKTRENSCTPAYKLASKQATP